jgi:hypothetical protein
MTTIDVKLLLTADLTALETWSKQELNLTGQEHSESVRQENEIRRENSSSVL